jgi:sulfite reductase beta subunit-like hemoprotein
VYTDAVIYILGLLARSGHGKTTVAQHLVSTHGAEVRSLAGPMKRALQNVFSFSTAQLWGTQAEKEATDPRYGFSPRWLLQRLGTEGLRHEFGEDVHVRALARALAREERARPAGAPPRLYVVDDVRFANDARFIARGGEGHLGAVMKIVQTDVAPKDHSGHASERAIDEVAADDIAAVVVSSRGQGIAHMLGAVERALRSSARFDPLRPALRAPSYPLSPAVRRGGEG